MVYVTGDLHGDLSRFKSKELKKLKKNDTLIVCGDFGFLWDGSKKEQRVLKWIGNRKYNVLFLDGDHDNLSRIMGYPRVKWHGGEAHHISGRLMHLCRGHIFTIENSSVFVFGGGESADLDIRLSFTKWMAEQIPTQKEIDFARRNLEKHGNKVDYIVTHHCSQRIRSLLTMRDTQANILTAFFDEVRDTCSYTRWFFGSMHLNKSIPPRDVALFTSLVAMTPDSILKNVRNQKR